MSKNSKRQMPFIHLKNAIKWYNSENEELKELALKLYSKKELTTGLFNITSYIESWEHTSISVPTICVEKIKMYSILNMYANYFNDKDWGKTEDNIGFCIQIYDNIIIPHSHDSIIMTGVVYFQREKDIKKVIDLLKEQLLKLN